MIKTACVKGGIVTLTEKRSSLVGVIVGDLQSMRILIDYSCSEWLHHTK